MKTSELTSWFLKDFWPLYLELMKTPYSTQFGAGNRGEALKSMIKLNPSEDIRHRMVEHLEMQVVHRRGVNEVCGSRQNYEATVKYQKFYCNRHGATWINNMGWFDEVPEIEIKHIERVSRQISHPSHKAWEGH